VGPKGIFLGGRNYNNTVAGITVVDTINHGITIGGDQKEKGRQSPNMVHHIKIFGWRANGDGIHCFGFCSVSDAFFRTQDDCLYVSAGARYRNPQQKEEAVLTHTFRRITTWNDANGTSFVLAAEGTLFSAAWTHHDTILEDSEVMYSRRNYDYGCGAMFSLKDGGLIRNFMARNIRSSDKFPSCPLFQMSGVFSNITFEKITMEHPSALYYTNRVNCRKGWKRFIPPWNAACKASLNAENGRFDQCDCEMPYGAPNIFMNAARDKKNPGDEFPEGIGKCTRTQCPGSLPPLGVFKDYNGPSNMDGLVLRDVKIAGEDASVLVTNLTAFYFYNVSNVKVEDSSGSASFSLMHFDDVKPR
jgi:hypothetical protein